MNFGPEEILLSLLIYGALLVQMMVTGFCANRALGLWSSSLWQRQGNPWIVWALDLAAGYLVTTTVLFVLAAFGLMTFKGFVIGNTLVTGATVLVASYRSTWRTTTDVRPDGLSTLGVLITLVAVTLFSVRPIGHGDEMSYHLPLAKHYAEQGSLIVQPYLRYPLFPHNPNLLMSLGFLTGDAWGRGALIAQYLMTFPFFIVALGVVGTFQWISGSPWLGFVTIALIFGRQPVKESLGYAYVDTIVMMVCWISLLAAAISVSLETNRSRWWRPFLIFSGAIAGLAMGSKFMGVVFATLPAIWLLFARRDWRGAVLYGGIAAMFGVWWYVRAWLVSGDPIHPLGGSIFGFYLWDAQDLAEQIAEQKTHFFPREIGYLWLALKKSGMAIWIVMPLALLYWRRLGQFLGMMLWTTVAFTIAWQYLFQIDRYLSPAVPSGMILCLWVASQLLNSVMEPFKLLQRFFAKPQVKRAIALGMTGSLFIPLSWAVSQVRYETMHWNEIMSSRPGFALIQRANALGEIYGRRYFNAGYVSVFFFDGVAVGDVFGPGRFRQLEGMQDPSLVKSVMQRHHTNILVMHCTDCKTEFKKYDQLFNMEFTDGEGMVMTIKGSAQ